MSGHQRSMRGFTLIELLVVIAIIGILAAFLVGGIFRYLEKAKIADANNTMRNIELELVDYYTSHNSYPPAYGFLSKKAFGLTPEQRKSTQNIADPGGGADYVLDRTNPDPLHSDYFATESFMTAIGRHGNLDYYDPFALAGADTDYDGSISRLEYYPGGAGDDERVVPSSEYGNAEFNYLDFDQRPFLYVAVNLRDFRRVKEIWDENGGYPTVDNSVLEAMNFPPASYDAFILSSAGVVTNTQGTIYDVGGNAWNLNDSNYEENYYYHIAAMATYYILTRDIDNDGVYDFDHVGRSTGDQAGHSLPVDYHSAPRGPGAVGPIYRVMP